MLDEAARVVHENLLAFKAEQLARAGVALTRHGYSDRAVLEGIAARLRSLRQAPQDRGAPGARPAAQQLLQKR